MIKASRSLHRRHCARCPPWTRIRMFRRLVPWDPCSGSECCWYSRVRQGSLKVLPLRPTQSRGHRGRPAHRRGHRRGHQTRTRRCLVAGSGSPPLRIGSQTDQFNCSDIRLCQIKATNEIWGQTLGRPDCTHFAIFGEVDLQRLRIVFES